MSMQFGEAPSLKPVVNFGHGKRSNLREKAFELKSKQAPPNYKFNRSHSISDFEFQN